MGVTWREVEHWALRGNDVDPLESIRDKDPASASTTGQVLTVMEMNLQLMTEMRELRALCQGMQEHSARSTFGPAAARRASQASDPGMVRRPYAYSLPTNSLATQSDRDLKEATKPQRAAGPRDNGDMECASLPSTCTATGWTEYTGHDTIYTETTADVPSAPEPAVARVATARVHIAQAPYGASEYTITPVGVASPSSDYTTPRPAVPDTYSDPVYNSPLRVQYVIDTDPGITTPPGASQRPRTFPKLPAAGRKVLR